jgi:polysaccharide biosynthesis transport protein
MQPEFQYKKYLQLVVRNKERFTLVALLLMTIVFAVSFLLPRKYEASSTVFIEKNVISELVKGITVTPSMEDTINVLTYAITSRTLLGKVVDSLDMNLGKSDSETEALIKSLQKKTKVKVKDKNLFTIAFTHEDPQVARDFVNTLVRLYIEENISSKRGESYDATKFLSEQIDNFNTKLEKAEAEVNAYKRDKGGIISIDEGRLFEEINTAQQKLYDLELRRRQLEGMRQVTRASADPMQARLAALQKRLEELRVEYTDSYPEVIKVRGEIETVKEQLSHRGRKGFSEPVDPQELSQINAEISAIRITESGLKRYIDSNRALLQSIPTAKAGLEKLELEKKNQKNIYDQLFARHGQSEVSKQMEVQDKSTTFRIVDPALLPVKPSSPNRLLIMLMGMAGGVGGSFGLLLLLDQLDGSVKDVDFVKALGTPVLAVIPRMEDPVIYARQRRRTRKVFVAAAAYLLFLLCFPAMELLGVGYMDKLLDTLHSGTHLTQSSKELLR